jgi:RHS repeat-associated protein
VTVSTGSVANPYRFGGTYEAYTDSSGLYKIGQRYYDYYDSSLGRWIQQDLPGSPAMLEAPFPDPGSVYGYTDRNCPLQSAFPD